MSLSQIGWDQLAGLKPTVKPQIRACPVLFRDELWYVLHDTQSGQHIRVNENAYRILSELDGERTVAEIAAKINSQGPDNRQAVIERSDVADTLVQLHGFDALSGFVTTSAKLKTEGRMQWLQQRRRRNWLNPLMVRIPLFDPDRWLGNSATGLHIPHWFGLIWLAVLCVAILCGVMHWSSISDQMSTALSSPHYFVLLCVLYPALKALHEFAHAWCLRRLGGEVHEMGITLLVFMPIPYVDASATWSLTSRYHRMLVSAAGVIAEVTVAALAFFIWLLVEPGLLHDAAFVLAVTGSLSTILFNANPLFRFDGYYVLQDWIEIPNLYSRSMQFLAYLCKRFLLRVSSAPEPVFRRDERAWLASYALLALLYRYIVSIVIAVWLIKTLFLPGLLLSVWLCWCHLARPVIRLLSFLRSDALPLSERRGAIGLLASFIVVMFTLTALLPVVHRTRVEGVVWVPQQAELYISASGFVAEVYARQGQWVREGEPLLRLSAPELSNRVDVTRARLERLQLQQAAKRFYSESDNRSVRNSALVDGVLLEQEISALKKELDDLQTRSQALTVVAPAEGVFTAQGDASLPGRYFTQGQLLGFIVPRTAPLVKAVVPQNKIGALRNGLLAADVRLAESFSERHVALLLRETPAADHRLPTAGLGQQGGGGIAIAASEDGRVALEPVFHIELQLQEPVPVTGIGERAYVTLHHRKATIAARLATLTQQLLLKHLSKA